MNFKAAGLPARTPVIIQVQATDGIWSTVDSVEVHYPAEPSDSQRYLDDAGYKGNFKVPDLDAPKPTPTPTPAPTASPTATPGARDLPSDRADGSSGRAQKDNPQPSNSSTPDTGRNSNRHPDKSGS